jgi:hypothetical protein
MKLNNSGNVGDIIEEDDVEDIVLRTSKQTSDEI